MKPKGLRITATRRAVLGSVIGAALTIGLATVVFACTYIPHLYALSPRAAVPGTDLTLQGNTASIGHPVTLRWNSRSGQVLATVMPDAQGNFTASVKVPDVSPGNYFIAADAGGDIARAGFQVIGASDSRGALPAPAVPDAATGSDVVGQYAAPPDTSTSNPALIAGLLVFAVAAFGAVTGMGLVLSRRRRVPTRVR